ncbi:hypothetical protein CVT24_002480 [Panaeolus cyanescens]|uniref:Uncharacterized protein n=1 Tax=Panaeolus cyanescens TaxID=181874 RepID=A0A409YTL1_9AGAR|nr:hypothetical protein CVT24_002480 [Panaeolus cyanescens]
MPFGSNFNFDYTFRATDTLHPGSQHNPWVVNYDERNRGPSFGSPWGIPMYSLQPSYSLGPTQLTIRRGEPYLTIVSEETQALADPGPHRYFCVPHLSKCWFDENDASEYHLPIDDDQYSPPSSDDDKDTCSYSLPVEGMAVWVSEEWARSSRRQRPMSPSPLRESFVGSSLYDEDESAHGEQEEEELEAEYRGDDECNDEQFDHKCNPVEANERDVASVGACDSS